MRRWRCSVWPPSGELDNAIVPGQVDVAFQYEQSFVGDDRRTSPFFFGPNGKWINDDENFYEVHLRVLF